MDVDKRAFSIDQFCSRYGVGRTTAYEEIKAKRLQVVKAGKRTLVPADAANLAQSTFRLQSLLHERQASRRHHKRLRHNL